MRWTYQNSNKVLGLTLEGELIRDLIALKLVCSYVQYISILLFHPKICSFTKQR